MYLYKQAEIKTKLLPHQQRVVDRIKSQQGLVVAHGLGSGKTLAAIASADAYGENNLALVPAALQENFNKEIQQHHRGPSSVEVASAQTAVLRGQPTQRDLLILDEAHRARETSTQLYKYIKKFPAKKKMLLTASPVYNSPADIAPLVNLVSGNRTLPTGRDFTSKYIQKADRGTIMTFLLGKQHPHLKNTSSLKKITDQWVDYHPSQGKDFPDRVDEVVYTPMSEQQTLLYRQAEGKIPQAVRSRMAAGLPPNKRDLASINAFQSQTRQISDSLDRYGVNNVPTPKIQRAVGDVLQELKHNKKHRAVVYSNFRSTLKDYASLLDKEKVPYSVFTGGMKNEERKNAVDRYNSGKSKVFLVSSAGGEGLDLKGTRQLQVLEPHWNDEKLNQVIGRAIRRGSHAALPAKDRNVIVRRYLTHPQQNVFQRILKKRPDSIEEYLYGMSKDKDMLNQEFIELLQGKANAKTKSI